MEAHPVAFGVGIIVILILVVACVLSFIFRDKTPDQHRQLAINLAHELERSQQRLEEAIRNFLNPRGPRPGI